MSIKDGQTEYVLSRPLAYSRGGNSTAQSGIITLREPGMEHVKFYLQLKQMLTRCQMEFAQRAGAIQEAIGEVQRPLHEDTDSIEAETGDMSEMFEMALMASETVDVSKFVETFRAMAVLPGAKRAVCMVDDAQQMTAALWDKLYPDDAFKMAVRWCVFFGMPSEEGEKTTSGQQSGSATEPKEV